MPVTACAFKDRPRVGRPAFLYIECTSPTEVRVTQGGRDLFNNIVTRKGYATIIPETADPIYIETIGDGGTRTSTVVPFVSIPRIDQLRVTRFAWVGKDLSASWKTTGSEAIAELIKDQLIDQRQGTGSDRCVFRPLVPGRYVFRLTTKNLTATATSAKLIFVGSWQPWISVDQEVKSGATGAVLRFSWKAKWAEQAFIERGGQRTPVALHDSYPLTVPDEARLIATGPGGTTTKILRAVPYFLHNMVED